MPKLIIEIDTENGYTQFFKRRDVLVKVMGEVEQVLRLSRMNQATDLSKIKVAGGGVSARWAEEDLTYGPGPLPVQEEEMVLITTEPPTVEVRKKRA